MYLCVCDKQGNLMYAKYKVNKYVLVSYKKLSENYYNVASTKLELFVILVT